MTPSTVGDMHGASLNFEAPGPGRWRLDQDHAERPVRRVGWDCWAGTEPGSAQAYESIGAIVRCIRVAHVHGWPYAQVELIDDDEQVDAREQRARAAIEDSTWRDVVDAWFDAGRGEFIARCLTLQRSLDNATIDLRQSAELITIAGELARAGFEKHFALLAGHLGAGLYLDQHAPGEERELAVAGLAGASPGSREPAELARAVAQTLGDQIHRVRDVDEIRHHSPAAARALERYLDLFGWRSLDGTPEAPTLLERPDLLLRSIQAQHDRRPSDPPGATGPESIPLDVRRSYALRDDNVGITCNWPPGLLRRATTQAGTALHTAGLLDDPELAFHLSVAELAHACEQKTAELNDVARAAAALHERALTASPPAVLDGERVHKSLGELPTHVALVTRALGTYQEPIPRAQADGGLVGVGVGRRTVRGIARVARDAIEASERIEPGDILVASVTDSGFNALLSLVDGLVTQHGGAMSHAALMARELDIPAVIGVPAALAEISDGALIELDPLAGSVTIIDHQ